MEHSKPEKPYWLLIHSIAITNSFLLNAYEKRHNTCYRGTADLKLHTHQDSSKAQIFCKRDKPKTVHTTSNNRCSAKSRCHLLHKHVIPRYKLSMWKLSQYFFLTLESYFQLLSWPHVTWKASVFGVNQNLISIIAFTQWKIIRWELRMLKAALDLFFITSITAP